MSKRRREKEKKEEKEEDQDEEEEEEEAGEQEQEEEQEEKEEHEEKHIVSVLRFNGKVRVVGESCNRYRGLRFSWSIESECEAKPTKSLNAHDFRDNCE
ncbi:hypothetical protein PoB_003635700 [Plakobranchus ocellatus]|uniref:Uncharacterized protein n=1 Tax=Plakobranchus ocellatus TaxID=259542 RepID=A0AAV4ASE1_9GAST|nr:hypothetical protein PoB_003635700 [Plakobranchus ocellatus]